MRDFADALDDRLRSLATLSEPVSRLSLVPPVTDAQASRAKSDAGRAPRPARAFRRPVFTGGMVTAIGLAATLLVLTGSSSGGLPIFETERSDASALRTNPTLSAADANFDAGHAFATPDGAGWVLTSRDGRTVCVTLPNRDATDSRGVACSPKTDVERHGMSIELVGDRAFDRHAKNRVAFVLPANASTVTLTTAGATTPLQADDGVAVAWLTAPATLTFRHGGRTERRSFDGAFNGGFFRCDGRRPPVDPRTGLRPPHRCR